ncbi:MAG: TetR/AcrR family transcriptional regulator [Gammaproteobacteria bacterium]
MSTKQRILKKALPLFAKKGYAGVSMRDLAKAVNFGVSALYHHFPDKKTLYLETTRLAFSNKAMAFSEVWQSESSAENRLKLFIVCLVDMMLADEDFARLIQRELLEADAERMRLLAEGVFKQQFAELMRLVEELAPGKDAHLTAVSILGLVRYHLEIQPLRQFLPGHRAEHEVPGIIANHVIDLLLNGMV